jgi:hypothetical protein
MGDFFLATLEPLFDAVDDDIDDILLLMASIKTYILKSAVFATNGHILAHYVRHSV